MKNYIAALITAPFLLTAHVASAQETNTNWTGAYAGFNAGYGFNGNNDVETTGQAAANVNNVNGGARPAKVSLNNDGFTGGGVAGYNMQSGHIVYGVETDLSYTDIGESKRVTTTALNGVDQLNNDFEQNLDYLGTLRGRVGYAYNNTLIYGTGGLAYGGVDNKATFFGPVGQEQFTGSKDGVEFGYTVGGGVEQALANNWTVNAGYLYYDLADTTANVAVIPGNGGGGTGYNSKFDNDGHLFRIGMNYKFN